jgi:two-component system, OmpR family, sensor histidine kinase KdpD
LLGHRDAGVSAVTGGPDARGEIGDAVEAAGRFRIYLGAASGVGKTCAMLDEGRRRQRRGADVAVGFVEGHGRRYPAQLMDGLEIVGRRVVAGCGTRSEEMDVQAVLARQPEVALVDELAHTHTTGKGPIKRRWQEIIELLNAGIDVVSTVNIQHVESVADAAERITGSPIRDRVPDWVLRRADQIELVDSSPVQLRRRLLHGNIRPPEDVSEALAGPFRTDNLMALREFALRFLADETDQELLNHVRWRHSDDAWETSERILVAVTTAPGTDAIVRRASRIASRTKADLQVLHVIVDDSIGPSSNDQLISLRQLTADVGAEWNQVRADDPAQALIEFAHSQQITQVVVGSTGRPRRLGLLDGSSFVRRVSRLAARSDIDIHIVARREKALASTEVSAGR